MFISLNQLGSLVVDVNQDRMDVAFLMADQSIGDFFTLLQAPPGQATSASSPDQGRAALLSRSG